MGGEGHGWEDEPPARRGERMRGRGTLAAVSGRELQEREAHQRCAVEPMTVARCVLWLEGDRDHRFNRTRMGGSRLCNWESLRRAMGFVRTCGCVAKR